MINKIKEAILMCGLPRSGKTTETQKYKDFKYFILSKDLIRLQLFNKRFYQDGEYLVLSTFKTILNYVIKQELDIVIDETNLTIQRRKELIDFLKKNGYEVTIIYLKTSKEDCIHRAKITMQTDLIPIIESMSLIFQKPSSQECDNFVEIG